MPTYRPIQIGRPRPGGGLAEHARADRDEPNTFARQRRQVVQSGAYQNWSRLWNLIQPSLPPGVTPPLVYFGTTTNPLTGEPSPRGATFYGPTPGAGYMGGPYKGRVVALPDPESAVNRLGRIPTLIDKLLHETAHTVQAPEVFTTPALAEGGADAMAQIYRNAAAKMLGFQGTLPPYWGYGAPDPSKGFTALTAAGAYAPADAGTWFLRNFGRKYARTGQFNPAVPTPVLGALGPPTPNPAPPTLHSALIRHLAGPRNRYL